MDRTDWTNIPKRFYIAGVPRTSCYHSDDMLLNSCYHGDDMLLNSCYHGDDMLLRQLTVLL